MDWRRACFLIRQARFGSNDLQCCAPNWYSSNMFNVLAICLAVMIGAMTTPSDVLLASDAHFHRSPATIIVEGASLALASNTSFKAGGNQSNAHWSVDHREPCQSDSRADCDFSGSSPCPQGCGVLGSGINLVLPDVGLRGRAVNHQRLTSLNRTSLLKPPIALA